MRDIPDFSHFNELNIYYRSENMENTDTPVFEDLDPKRPDAYIGFSNNIFFYPQGFFNYSGEILDSDWL